jgi:hypothetical protein
LFLQKALLKLAWKDNSMSGPKVVRVVTKQEIMANCQDRIEVVRDTIEQWRTFASKYDALHAEEEKTIEKKLHSIISLFEKEQFNDVPKQCSDQIIALRADMDRIREEAIAKAELERSMRRRVQHSAETLIKAFTTINRQIPQELLEIAASSLTADEKHLIGMNATLSRILTEYTISSVEKENMTPLQIELSKALAEGEKTQTLIDWKLLYNDNIKSIEIDHRLDKLLAEITTIENDDVAQPFLNRVTLIEKETSPKQRSLLTDSLILDLVTHSNNRKILDQEIVDMREVRSNLNGLNSQAAKDLIVLFTNAIGIEDISSYKILKDKADELLKSEKKAISSTSRREAILKGLAGLGYEVRENMATAWAENGRIVVKKPNEEGYGIELGAVEDAARMQVQLVSFDQSSDRSQDLNRETIWCSEFSHLKSVLAQSGSILHIEKALPVGSKPLKQVANATTTVQERRTKTTILRTKTHD